MKTNKGSLSMNNEYTFMGINDLGEMNYEVCQNCGRNIRYVCELKDSTNKKYYVGTECAKTLQQAKISNSYSMLEEIAEFKKLASIKSLIQNGTDVKIWAYSQNVMELIIVGKQGNTPKKMTLSRHYDLFKGEPYKFLDDYILELYKKPEIIQTDWCMAHVFNYFNSLKK